MKKLTSAFPCILHSYVLSGVALNSCLNLCNKKQKAMVHAHMKSKMHTYHTFI